MYAREEANRLITFVFYETNTKADWGSLGTELYLALGYDEIPSLAVEQHRSRGGGEHRLLSTSFFPCNAHRDNVKISLSKVARCPPPRSAAHGYLNIPS